MLVHGKESIFFVRHLGDWLPIGCETSNSMSETVEMIDTTTRDNKGWATARPTMQSYNITINGQLRISNTLDKASYYFLRDKKRSLDFVEWKRETVEEQYGEVGLGHIVSISNDAPADGFVTFTMQIQGYGSPDYSINAFEKIILISPNGTRYLVSALSDGHLLTQEEEQSAVPYIVLKGKEDNFKLTVEDDGRLVTESTNETGELRIETKDRIFFEVSADTVGRLTTIEL